MKIIRFLPVLIFIMICGQSLASTGDDFKKVDATTFRLYQEKKWDSLIMVGKKALKKDIDYYFLRMRLGIAYYSKTQYIPAANQFRKALGFNSTDPTAWDYLYNSYVLANRNHEAIAIVRKMPGVIQKKYEQKRKFLEMITFEGGPTLSSDNNKHDTLTISSKPGPYGERDLYGNSYYGKLGLLMNLSNRVNLTVEYNYLDFSKRKSFQYSQFNNHLSDSLPWARGLIYNYLPPALYNADYSYHVSQQDVYLSSEIVTPWGFRIEPALHAVYVYYTIITPQYTKTSVVDIAVKNVFNPDSNIFVTVQKETYAFIQKDTSFLNYVASLSISKDFSIFNVRLSGSFSNLNHKRQSQVGGSFTFYPLGNLDFYGVSTVTGFFQKKDTRLILGQSVGGRLLRRAWLEGNVLYGDLTNSNIANGSIVYNNADKIDYRVGGTLMWLLSDNIELSFTYQYFQKESATLYYVFDRPAPDTHTITQTEFSKYHTNTLILGIKWKL